MLNDRDEEHYNHEESEYHFSDEDVNYEVEPEASKPAAPESDSRKAPIAGLTPTKRMGIALVVFLGLVFVVYKMVSPGTTIPSTDISPTVTQAAPVSAEPPPISHPSSTQAQAGNTASPQEAPVAASQPTPAVPDTTPASNAAPIANPPVATAPSVPASQPVAPQPAAPQPTTSSAAAQPPASVPAATTNPVLPAAASAPSAAANPQPVTTIVTTAPTASTPVAATTNNVAPANNMDGAIAAMAASNERLMNQLQADYTQKVVDYGNQTRLLQDQMQTLNSRVAGLESQLSQLVQTLSRQAGMGASNNLNVIPAQQPMPQMAEPKVSYNVQAIIPGRAWLKSDNGETLTVAEGDTIKELGRVTKIDPYDGVVEVNTGNKTVSISYGNSG